MSLERNSFGDFEITCDECGSNDIYGADFHEAISEAKDDGWIFFKDGTGNWLHFHDSRCRDDYLKEQ